MKQLIFITIILSANLAHAYPAECTKFENKLIDYAAKLNSGVEPNGDVGKINPEMNAILDKYPECNSKVLFLAQKMTDSITTFIELDKAKKAKATKTKSQANVVTYDEWFTLTNSGIKSGKKYSFMACVIGNRNSTAVACHIPGSAAKRVFYNTDDIKDNATKQRWINSINEKKCVTAYVTGGETFVTDIQESCN